MLSWRAGGIGLVVGVCSMGCALGSSPLLHHPNRAGRFGGYIGYSLPIQPATARVIVTPAYSRAAPFTRELSANSGVLIPVIVPGYVAYVYDPKLYGSAGLTDHLTLTGEVGWHRVGVAGDYFTSTEGRGGFKLAGGVSTGIFVSEFYGWAEVGWLPMLTEDWSGYVGVGSLLGRFRHFFRLPEDLDRLYEMDESMPTVASFADLLRKEVRLRLPIGVSVWPKRKGPSVSLGAIPYATLAHGEPQLVNCFGCESDAKFLEFKQDWGIEFQGGIRL